MENQDKKKILIINAALKRIAHYGLAKTTMTDIAKDISFSKALLYYYFPDKLSLYVSVIEHLMHTISREIRKAVEKTDSAKEGIMMLLQKRQGYIQKYYNLLEPSKLACTELPENLDDKFNKAREFEVKILTGLLVRGTENGEFEPQDNQLITEIFIEALSGIHFNILNKEKSFFPDKGQFKEIFTKEKKFAEVFLRGLSLIK